MSQEREVGAESADGKHKEYPHGPRSIGIPTMLFGTSPIIVKGLSGGCWQQIRALVRQEPWRECVNEEGLLIAGNPGQQVLFGQESDAEP